MDLKQGVDAGSYDIQWSLPHRESKNKLKTGTIKELATPPHFLFGIGALDQSLDCRAAQWKEGHHITKNPFQIKESGKVTKLFSEILNFE